jgi:xylulokinase
MEVATGKLMGVDSYDIITSTAKNSTVGANGITALTGFQGSHTRYKNENARGTFFGLTLCTKKADIAQAILEGICFEMKDILLMNEELAGEIKHVRLCGGTAKSEMWSQMFADILCKPVELTAVPELGCLGAAMCAGIGAGVFESLEAAVENCVHITKVFTPDEQRVPVYREVFARWNRYNEIAIKTIY